MNCFLNQDLVACEGFTLCPDQDEVATEGFAFFAVATHTKSVQMCDALVLDCSKAAKREMELQKQIQTLKRTCRRQRVRIRELSASHREIRNRGANETRAHVGMLVALARNRGCVSGESAAGFSDFMFHRRSSGISRQTLSRWEHAAGTSLLAAASMFHRNNELVLATQRGHTAAYTMVTHRIRSDAGNSKAARRVVLVCIHVFSIVAVCAHLFSNRQQKLQPMELLSSYLFDDGDVAEHIIFPDVQVVYDGSGAGCVHLTHRQLRLAGCIAFDGDLAAELGPLQFRHIALCGDCGTDQIGMRRIIAERFAQCLRVWVTGTACFAHQGNLSSCAAVGVADLVSKFWGMDWTYYSVLVKLTNLLRSKPREVQNAAAEIADVMSMDAKRAKRKVCSCTTGRWGSVSTCEDYYLGFSSYTFVQQVLAKVCTCTCTCTV